MNLQTTKPTEARCFLCKETFDISCMRISILTSHVAGKKHQIEIPGKSSSMYMRLVSSKGIIDSKKVQQLKKLKKKQQLRVSL